MGIDWVIIGGLCSYHSHDQSQEFCEHNDVYEVNDKRIKVDMENEDDICNVHGNS